MSIEATVYCHNLTEGFWTLEVAICVPSDATLPGTGEPHPGAGLTFDAEGRPFLLRSFVWDASRWVDEDGQPRDTPDDRRERREDALAQLEAEEAPAEGASPNAADVGQPL